MKNTVQDLINALSKIENKNLVISMEGCDCHQDWGGQIEEYGGKILLYNDTER